MPEQWSDNQPGWELRLRKHLDAIGLEAARREIADNVYRPNKVPKQIAEQWVREKEEAPAAAEAQNSLWATVTPMWWGVGVAVVAAFIALLALLYNAT